MGSGSKLLKAGQIPLVFALISTALIGEVSATQDPPPPQPTITNSQCPGTTTSTCFIDLTVIPSTQGDSPTAQLSGGIFSAPDINGALGKGTIVGTGVFQPFVRIQESGTGSGDGVEAGLNTNWNPQILDNHNKGDTNWNHALKLSDVGQVCLGPNNTNCYYEFLLDINEQGNDNNKGLSLDEFKLFTSNSDTEHLIEGNVDTFGYNPTTTLNGAVAQYDMDANGDYSVLLNYANQSGSGNGVDLQVLVPVTSLSGEYVYLFSKFGVSDQLCKKNAGDLSPCQTPNGPLSDTASALDYSQDAGFEEWSTRTRTAPLPATPLLLGLALASVAFVRRRASRKAVICHS